jgi:hypothetical protein
MEELRVDPRAAAVDLVHLQEVEYHRDQHLILHAEELGDAVGDPRFQHIELDQSQIYPAVERGRVLGSLGLLLDASRRDTAAEGLPDLPVTRRHRTWWGTRFEV